MHFKDHSKNHTFELFNITNSIKKFYPFETSPYNGWVDARSVSWSPVKISTAKKPSVTIPNEKSRRVKIPNGQKS